MHAKTYLLPPSYTTAKGHFPFEMLRVPTLHWFFFFFLNLKLCLKAVAKTFFAHLILMSPGDVVSLMLKARETTNGPFLACFCLTALLKSYQDVPSSVPIDSH